MKRSAHPVKLSYWEIKQYLQDIDLIVVGSGIVGLTTAIFYQKIHPDHKTLIIEKGVLPSGASTKNAGFACFGSPSELLSDLKSSTEEEVFETVAARISGLNKLRELAGDHNLDYRNCGGYEVFQSDDRERYDECRENLEYLNRTIHSVSGLKETFSMADAQIANQGFAQVEHLLFNQHEGSLDTGKMMNALTKMAISQGVTILNSLEVSQFFESDNHVEVLLTNDWTLRTRRLHFATNGFAQMLFPDLDVKPARAQVLITTPVRGLKINGTFHMNEGYYYFRNVGDRVLFGGGRQLDKEGETTSNIDITPLIQTELENLLREVILPNSEFEIEHRWAGIMGVGKTKKPIIKSISNRISCSVRLGGMGVAIGTSTGKQAAEMIA